MNYVLRALIIVLAISNVSATEIATLLAKPVGSASKIRVFIPEFQAFIGKLRAGGGSPKMQAGWAALDVDTKTKLTQFQTNFAVSWADSNEARRLLLIFQGFVSALPDPAEAAARAAAEAERDAARGRAAAEAAARVVTEAERDAAQRRAADDRRLALDTAFARDHQRFLAGRFERARDTAEAERDAAAAARDAAQRRANAYRVVGIRKHERVVAAEAARANNGAAAQRLAGELRTARRETTEERSARTLAERTRDNATAQAQAAQAERVRAEMQLERRRVASQRISERLRESRHQEREAQERAAARETERDAAAAARDAAQRRVVIEQAAAVAARTAAEREQEARAAAEAQAARAQAERDAAQRRVVIEHAAAAAARTATERESGARTAAEAQAARASAQVTRASALAHAYADHVRTEAAELSEERDQAEVLLNSASKGLQESRERDLAATTQLEEANERTKRQARGRIGLALRSSLAKTKAEKRVADAQAERDAAQRSLAEVQTASSGAWRRIQSAQGEAGAAQRAAAAARSQAARAQADAEGRIAAAQAAAREAEAQAARAQADAEGRIAAAQEERDAAAAQAARAQAERDAAKERLRSLTQLLFAEAEDTGARAASAAGAARGGDATREATASLIQAAWHAQQRIREALVLHAERAQNLQRALGKIPRDATIARFAGEAQKRLAYAMDVHDRIRGTVEQELRQGTLSSSATLRGQIENARAIAADVDQLSQAVLAIKRRVVNWKGKGRTIPHILENLRFSVEAGELSAVPEGPYEETINRIKGDFRERAPRILPQAGEYPHAMVEAYALALRRHEEDQTRIRGDEHFALAGVIGAVGVPVSGSSLPQILLDIAVSRILTPKGGWFSGESNRVSAHIKSVKDQLTERRAVLAAQTEQATGYSPPAMSGMSAGAVAAAATPGTVAAAGWSRSPGSVGSSPLSMGALTPGRGDSAAGRELGPALTYGTEADDDDDSDAAGATGQHGLTGPRVANRPGLRGAANVVIAAQRLSPHERFIAPRGVQPADGAGQELRHIGTMLSDAVRDSRRASERAAAVPAGQRRLTGPTGRDRVDAAAPAAAAEPLGRPPELAQTRSADQGGVVNPSSRLVRRQSAR